MSLSSADWMTRCGLLGSRAPAKPLSAKMPKCQSLWLIINRCAALTGDVLTSYSPRSISSPWVEVAIQYMTNHVSLFSHSYIAVFCPYRGPQPLPRQTSLKTPHPHKKFIIQGPPLQCPSFGVLTYVRYNGGSSRVHICSTATTICDEVK